MGRFPGFLSLGPPFAGRRFAGYERSHPGGLGFFCFGFFFFFFCPFLGFGGGGFPSASFGQLPRLGGELPKMRLRGGARRKVLVPFNPLDRRIYTADVKVSATPFLSGADALRAGPSPYSTGQP